MTLERLNELQAFHNDPKVKMKYLGRVKAHEKADEIIHGVYWEDGKGCAVGCTVEKESNAHEAMEKELGIPQWLALLEDTIFEGLENGESKIFPRKFLESIKVGADLSLVKPKFLLFTLQNLPKDYEKRPDCKKAIEDIIVILAQEAQGKTVKQEVKEAAESAAESARSAAESARSAAESARSAAYVKMADELLRLLKEAR